MNRSILSLAALSAMYAHTAAPISLLPKDTRHAGQYSPGLLSIDDDNPDAGGSDKKDDSVTLAKGTLVGEGTEQTQQQAAAASTAAPGTEQAKAIDNVGALGTGEVKAAIGDPAGVETQQN